MKKCIVFPLLLSVVFLFSSCEEVSVFLPDEDCKTLQISQLPSMFDSIARQPEAADEIISATQSLLYDSYEDILPLNDQAIYQRGVALGLSLGAMFEAVARQPEAEAMFEAVARQPEAEAMFEAVARQPEAEAIIDGAAELFIGPYSAGHITGDLLKYAKAAAGPLSESIARQPECFDTFDTLCIKYLNVTISEISE